MQTQDRTQRLSHHYPGNCKYDGGCLLKGQMWANIKHEIYFGCNSSAKAGVGELENHLQEQVVT